MSGVASSSSGRIPQGEVIVDYADGGTYVKNKLEESVLEIEKRRITKEEGRKAQAAMQALEVKDKAAGPGIKSEDVDFITHQMSCTRTEAEDALKASGGDLIKALLQMVKPAKRARSVDGGAQV